MQNSINDIQTRLDTIDNYIIELSAYHAIMVDKMEITDEKIIRYTQEYHELLQAKYAIQFKIIEEQWLLTKTCPITYLLSIAEFMSEVDKVWTH